MAEDRTLAQNNIVQVTPEQGDFAGALVVVTEVRSWGVIGYVQIPRGGQAYIRLEARHFEQTGGRVRFALERADG